MTKDVVRYTDGGPDGWMQTPTGEFVRFEDYERLRAALQAIADSAECPELPAMAAEALRGDHEPDGDLSTRYAVERRLTAKYEGALMSVISTESLSYAKDVAKVAMGVGRKAPERCIRCGLTRVEHDNPDEFQPAMKSAGSRCTEAFHAEAKAAGVLICSVCRENLGASERT